MKEKKRLVKCNNCAWEGSEYELIIADDDVEECPDCMMSDGLVDLPVYKQKNANRPK